MNRSIISFGPVFFLGGGGWIPLIPFIPFPQDRALIIWWKFLTSFFRRQQLFLSYRNYYSVVLGFFSKIFTVSRFQLFPEKNRIVYSQARTRLYQCSLYLYSFDPFHIGYLPVLSFSFFVANANEILTSKSRRHFVLAGN